jgi:uncharacterized protein (DUF486 family)
MAAAKLRLCAIGGASRRCGEGAAQAKTKAVGRGSFSHDGEAPATRDDTTCHAALAAMLAKSIDWPRRLHEMAASPASGSCVPGPAMSILLSPRVLPVLLLVVSNIFMTFAWYGHLRYKASPIWLAVMASWMIAFFEYWLAVPANRIGSAAYSAAELKTMQEVITLSVFAVFSVVYLKEALTWNHALGFALIAGGAALIFRG